MQRVSKYLLKKKINDIDTMKRIEMLVFKESAYRQLLNASTCVASVAHDEIISQFKRTVNDKRQLCDTFFASEIGEINQSIILDIDFFDNTITANTSNDETMNKLCDIGFALIYPNKE